MTNQDYMEMLADQERHARSRIALANANRMPYFKDWEDDPFDESSRILTQHENESLLNNVFK